MKPNNPEDNQLENKDWIINLRLRQGLWQLSPESLNSIELFIQSLLDKQVGKWVECMDCKAHKAVMVCIPCRNRFRDRALDKQAEKQRERMNEIAESLQDGDLEGAMALADKYAGNFEDLTNNNET